MEARRNLLGGSYHRSSASNAYLFEMERHDLIRGKMSKYNSTVLELNKNSGLHQLCAYLRICLRLASIAFAAANHSTYCYRFILPSYSWVISSFLHPKLDISKRI